MFLMNPKKSSRCLDRSLLHTPGPTSRCENHCISSFSPRKFDNKLCLVTERVCMPCADFTFLIC